MKGPLEYGRIALTEITPSDSELSARLSMRSTASSPEVVAALKALTEVATPAFVLTRLPVSAVSEGCVTVGEWEIPSRDLSAYFRDCRETALMMATLGHGVDRLIARTRARSITDAFIINAVASAAIEAVCDTIEKRSLADISHRNRFSPGYGDLPLSLQRDIIRLLDADKYLGVKETDSLLLTPFKTVSAFIAIKADKE